MSLWKQIAEIVFAVQGIWNECQPNLLLDINLLLHSK